MRKLFLSLLFVVTGCAHGTNLSAERKAKAQSLMVDHAPKSTQDHLLSRGQASKDLDLLTYALLTGYAGAKYVPQDKFTKAIDELNQIKTNLPTLVKISDLCKQAAMALAKIPDRHLELEFSGKNCNTEPKPIAQVGPNYGKKTKIAWEQNLFQVSDALSVPVFSIHYFPLEEDAEWYGFQEAVESEMLTAEAIVIDLRGNGGGNDAQGYWLAKTLYGDTPLEPYRRVILRQTPEALALFINSLHLIELDYKKEKQPIPEELSKHISQYRENFKLALDGNIPEENIQNIPNEKKPFNPKKGFHHPIYILVDRNTESSGESTLAFLRSHPKAKVIGENTYGAIHFGNQGKLFLPESGIEALMGTHFAEDKDGDYFEVVGYSPDVRTPPGKDAIQWVKDDLLKAFGYQ